MGKESRKTPIDVGGMKSDQEAERAAKEMMSVYEKKKKTEMMTTISDVKASDVNAQTKTRDILNAQRKIKITVPSTETQKGAVNVAINGIAFNIPRDKEVEVPQDIVQVLKDAVTINYSQKKREDGEEGNELVERKSQRFAFQQG